MIPLFLAMREAGMRGSDERTGSLMISRTVFRRTSAAGDPAARIETVTDEIEALAKRKVMTGPRAGTLGRIRPALPQYGVRFV